jgi:integrase
MDNIRHSVRAFIKGYNAKENNEITGKVVIRCKWSAGEIMLFTGYYAESMKWDATQQRCIRNTTHANKKKRESASQINAKITKIEEAIDNAFISFGVNGITAKDITPKDLKMEVYKRLDLSQDDIISRQRVAREEVNIIPAESKTLFNYLDDFISDGTRNGWRLDTIKKFGTLKNKLKCFDKVLSFDRLDEERLKSFVVYLTATCDYRNVSVQSMIKNLRWFLRWCEKKNLIHDKNVIDFKSKLKDVEDKTIVFLTWDEFQQIYSYNVPESKQYLQRVKDVFIFQCATGLRYADLAGLKRSNVDLANDEFTIVTSKTSHQIPIDFNSYSRAVYEKYKDDTFEDDAALPVPSNQKYNEYLKELCHLAGINSKITIAYKTGNEVVSKDVEKWTKISTHSGRRTFVSVGLSLGATPEEIARVTGHHSIQIMEKHYIGLDDKQRKHATSVWDEKTERESFIERINQMPMEEIRKMFALWDASGKE